MTFGLRWLATAVRAAASCRSPGRAALLLFALPALAQNSATPAQLPGKVAIAQKLGAQIPLDLMFRNEEGEIVRLRQLFGHGRPVVLNFVYFRCPMLCPMVLEGAASAFSEMKFDIGSEFDVITVSIDPRDKAAQAAEFKDKYVKRYGRLSAAKGWHFLTSNDSAIHALANAVGFQYAYDATRDEFAHAAAMLVLTPEGKLSRYFYGFEFKPRDLRLALVEAGGGKIGTLTDQFMLLCYHYDPAIGKYSRNALNLMRAGGVVTVVALGGFIFVLVKHERHKDSTE